MKLRRVIAIAIAVMTMVTMSFTTTVFGDEPQADPQDNAVVATDEEVEATEAVEQESTPAPSSEAVETVEEPAYGEASGVAKVVLKTEGTPEFPNFDAFKNTTKNDVHPGVIALQCYGAHYIQGYIWLFNSNDYDYIKLYRSVKRTKGYKVVKTIKNTSTSWVTQTDGIVISFTDKKVKAGKKYYYKVRAYRYGVSGYDTLNYTDMGNNYLGEYQYPFKVTKNTFTFGKSANYGAYSEEDPLPIRSMKLYYSKGRLVAKVKIHNESGHKVKRFTNYNLEVYDYDGELVAAQTFGKRTLNVKKNKFKTVTFKFSKSKTYINIKNFNLRYDLGGYKVLYHFY